MIAKVQFNRFLGDFTDLCNYLSLGLFEDDMFAQPLIEFAQLDPAWRVGLIFFGEVELIALSAL